MWHSEAQIFQSMSIVTAAMVFMLTLEQINSRHVNIIVKRFLPLIIICHFLSIDITTPVALEQFNFLTLKILTYDCWNFTKSQSKTLMNSVAYNLSSPVKNMFPIGFYMLVLLCLLLLGIMIRWFRLRISVKTLINYFYTY